MVQSKLEGGARSTYEARLPTTKCRWRTLHVVLKIVTLPASQVLRDRGKIAVKRPA